MRPAAFVLLVLGQPKPTQEWIEYLRGGYGDVKQHHADAAAPKPAIRSSIS